MGKTYRAQDSNSGVWATIYGPFIYVTNAGDAGLIDETFLGKGYPAGVYIPTVVTSDDGFVGNGTARFACREWKLTSGTWTGTMYFLDAIVHVSRPVPPPPPPDVGCGWTTQSSQLVFEETWTAPSGGGCGGSSGTVGNGLTCYSEYIYVDRNDGYGWYQIWEGWATVCY